MRTTKPFRITDEERLALLAERARKASGGRRTPTAALLDLDEQEPVFDIPYGYVDTKPPVKIEGERVGIISDVHIPSHDKRATEAAIKHLRGEGVDTLVLNGDIVDCYRISAHDQDPLRAVTFGDELEDARTIIGQIRNYLGSGVKIYYQEGNHEERFNRFLPKELAGDKVRGSTMREQLDLEKYKIEWVGERRGIDAGDLRIFHGHELRAAGVNPTRAMLTKTMHNVIVGHLHRSHSYVKPKLNGSYLGAWVTGCLCDLRPQYAPVNEWVHGFAIVNFNVSGTFSVHNKLIIDGVVV